MADILRSSAKVSLAVLASRVLGVVRESMFAGLFGVGPLTDAYVVAFRIPNLLRDLFAEGALSSAFVPTFAQALADGQARTPGPEGKRAAYHLGDLVMTGALLVTGILTIAGILFAVPVVQLISGGFEGANAAYKLEHAATLTRVMMPILTLISVSAVWMGMLNAQRHFTVPALAPALFNVTNILAALGLVALGMRSWPAMLAWSVATTISAAVQAFCQIPALIRLGHRPSLRLQGLLRNEGVRRILRLMAPACVGLAAIQLNVFINTYFAAQLGDGPQSQLNYAFRLFYLPIGVFGVALGTVTTTRVSEEAARGDRAALLSRTADGVRAVWMLASASAVGLIVLAVPIVQLLFEHGRFTPAMTAELVPVVQAYMVGVLPYSLVKVFAPAFYTLDRPRIPMAASMCSVAATIAFNALTYRWLGAWGLAFGTTLAAAVNLTVLRVAYSRAVGRLATARVREISAVAVANVVLAAVAWGLWRGCAALLGFVPPALPRGLVKVAHAGLLFTTIGVAFLAYGETLRRLGYPGAADLMRIPSRIASKLRGR